MKKLAAVILTLIMCLATGAQTDNSLFKPKRQKVLEDENARLRVMVDSLCKAIDDLNRRHAELVDSTSKKAKAPVLEGPEMIRGQYSAERRDSLLCLWYENRTLGDFDAVHEYDMDSVLFSSNVPDSVMIERLGAMNSFITIPFNSTVKNYMILYSEKMRSSMGRIMGLSRYYFPLFEAAFTRYGLPVELEYMAVVESMLVPTATSRVGAKGMWQFIYRAALDYGLVINSFVDERLDVEKAVDAAARLLRDSYRIFGDWSLAVSAYNCGAGNVRKAIARAGGKSDFWSVYPYLPRETRGYVPACVGVMYAMKYAREYGIAPSDVGMPAYADTFHIDKRLYFKQITEVVGIPAEELRTQNPQYYRDVVPGTEKNKAVLRIPYHWTNDFMSFSVDSLANYKRDEFAALINRGADEPSGAGYLVYTVRSGDTLSGIAKRYRGVTVNSLMKYNGLKSTTLRIGQKIRIPR